MVEFFEVRNCTDYGEFDKVCVNHVQLRLLTVLSSFRNGMPCLTSGPSFVIKRTTHVISRVI